MEELFYEEYAKALKEENIGKFSEKQMFVCWVVVSLLGLSAINLFIASIVKNTMWLLVGIVIYAILLVVAEIFLDVFEKKRRLRLYTEACDKRVKCMLATIQKFLKDDRLDEKFDFLIYRYEQTSKKYEEHAKAIRQVCVSITSLFGIVLTNAVNSPEKVGWRELLTLFVLFLFLSVLILVPMYLTGVFDSKKKMYSFMIMELQTIRLVIPLPENNSVSGKISGEKNKKNR